MGHVRWLDGSLSKVWWAAFDGLKGRFRSLDKPLLFWLGGPVSISFGEPISMA